MAAWRSLSYREPSRDAENRIRRYAETARRDPVPALVEAWAEIQTESLMREILSSPMGWISRRPSDIDAYVATAACDD